MAAEEDRDQFFDSREDFSSTSGSCSDDDFIDWASGGSGFDVWAHSPGSLRERRDKFMRWMGLDGSCSPRSEPACNDIISEIDRISFDSCVVVQRLDSDNGTSSSISGWASEHTSTLRSSGESVSDDSYVHPTTNYDDGPVDVPDAFAKDGRLRSLHKLRSNRMVMSDEFSRSFRSSSSFAQWLMRRDATESASSSEKTVRDSQRMGWLRKLGAVTCVVDRQVEESNSALPDSEQNRNGGVRRVKVRTYRKCLKEFSAVYSGQDIRAHDGAILTMKFSPDRQYLASGGEDGIVRVWRIMEREQTDEDSIRDFDPSCIYFTVNHNSELVPLYADRDKKGKSRNMRTTSDSACVVIPPQLFRISEKPVHEFHGHSGNVLDLSWSKDKYLLSSSVDKTVRLWKVGCSSCLKIFFHNNYVTCIQFNPVDENYFISGSIDGKVRIWEISECRVADWTPIKEIVTAVCYRPDGKGVVVGSMAGDCRFYDVSANHLQLDAQISLLGKKKSPFKRITGFQFCPTNEQKLMVTSADSQIRILDGIEIISKYRGIRKAGSQISASFTSDGRYIISASEDSNVYVWTHTNQSAPTSHQAKSTWSCEHFLSNNASVAIPWPRPEVIPSQQEAFRNQTGFPGNNTSHLSPAGSFTLSQDFLSEFLPKGSATWPEEKLPSSLATTPSLRRSQYKFFKTSSQNSSHAWGQVIVTGGWDGRIRSFQNYGLPVRH